MCGFASSGKKRERGRWSSGGGDAAVGIGTMSGIS